MNIEMPRGDLRPVRFTIRNPDGSAANIPFDEIYFTVKSNHTDKNYLIQKRLSDGGIARLDDGSYQFIILPEDTDNLRMTAYVFDIELVYRNAIKQTTVGKLTLTSEVTHAGNEV